MDVTVEEKVLVDGEKSRIELLVKKFNLAWSERFQFLSAVKLELEATCINVLPFEDYEGFSKYVAVGDEQGTVYVFLPNGDIVVEFNTLSESPISAMVSYMSIHKNESVLVTGHDNGVILVHRIWEASTNGEDWHSFSMANAKAFKSDGGREVEDYDFGVCQLIVIPNVSLWAEDKELFDMNYVEFIKRDMKDCDLDIRKSVCKLLKGIATNYKDQPFEDLTNSGTKYTRSVQLPDLIMFLTAESNVVRSYAVNCIEKLLLVKDEGGQARCGKLLNSIVTLLCQKEQDRDVEEAELPEIGENVCYTAQFVHLHNAGRRDEDPISEVNNVKKFFIQSLATRASESPGKIYEVPPDAFENDYMEEPLPEDEQVQAAAEEEAIGELNETIAEA
ncbi:hypothetical protein GIB67_005232 [Kingdonia uniflora]|uniref:Uncharacterized protein n=1 Tax=Kingdonia uniflora TaxID=39325 RepID=A0A7J7NNL6_9MAGN|nr:hypothetical protein GIB67_005232 [Kingdonia uniflora]